MLVIPRGRMHYGSYNGIDTGSTCKTTNAASQPGNGKLMRKTTTQTPVATSDLSAKKCGDEVNFHAMI
ncbi:hypothetical protein HJFPF1_12067 [Paramyrothecium foliicola]|nr:hypothetical protein HJFPF1_12067 [Paramyrothecium foliicola]